MASGTGIPLTGMPVAGMPVSVAPHVGAAQQLLVQPAPHGEAREMQVMQHGAYYPPMQVSGSALVGPGMSDAVQGGSGGFPETYDQRLRRRVVCVSIAIAVGLTLCGVAQLGAALTVARLIEQKLNEVAEIKNDPSLSQAIQSLPAAMVFWTVPGLAVSIITGLLFTLCACLGAKANYSCCACCFCCCNAWHVVVSCIALLLTLAEVNFAYGLQTSLDHFLQTCDPMQCMPEGLKDADREHAMDCLAAAMWPDGYARRYPDGPHLSVDCPPVFLQCNGSNSLSFFAEEADGAAAPHVETDELSTSSLRFDTASSDGSLSQENGRGLVARAKAPGNAEGRQRVAKEGFVGRQNKIKVPYKAIKMPEDPIKECEPSRVIEIFQAARAEAPEVFSQLVLLIVLRSSLLVPMLAIWALGFWWGQALWSKMQSGYAQIAAQQGHPQVMLQGFTLAPQATELQMAQPLIPSAPPPLATASTAAEGTDVAV